MEDMRNHGRFGKEHRWFNLSRKPGIKRRHIFSYLVIARADAILAQYFESCFRLSWIDDSKLQ